MQNFTEVAAFSAFGLFTLSALYAIIHMIYNRIKGKDELDDMFCFKRILKKRKWPPQHSDCKTKHDE